MGLRCAIAVLGAVILASTPAILATTLEPQRVEAAVTRTVKTCNGGSITLKLKEKRVFVLQNRTRRDYGLKPLCVNRQLTQAARSHSREMIAKGYFSHYSYNGESVASRLWRFGYDWSVYGENIAGGYSTLGRPRPIFERWMNSSSHSANILGNGFRQVGVGTCTGTYKGNAGYTMYTVDFGSWR